MDEPMLRAWMMESVYPAPFHKQRPGRWIAEPAWPPSGITTHRMWLTDEGLRAENLGLTPRAICSALTIGTDAGSWCPFGAGPDQAGDQRNDDAGSLIFETDQLDGQLAL